MPLQVLLVQSWLGKVSWDFYLLWCPGGQAALRVGCKCWGMSVCVVPQRGKLREAGLVGCAPPKLVPCCWKERCKASKISDTSCWDCNTALQERILRSWELLQSVTIHHQMGLQEHLCFWRIVAGTRRKWATGVFFLKQHHGIDPHLHCREGRQNKRKLYVICSSFDALSLSQNS